jgi:hypothetical protein
MIEDKKKLGLLALVALALIAAAWVLWPSKARAEGLPSGHCSSTSLTLPNISRNFASLDGL